MGGLHAPHRNKHNIVRSSVSKQPSKVHKTNPPTSPNKPRRIHLDPTSSRSHSHLVNVQNQALLTPVVHLATLLGLRPQLLQHSKIVHQVAQDTKRTSMWLSQSFRRYLSTPSPPCEINQHRGISRSDFQIPPAPTRAETLAELMRAPAPRNLDGNRASKLTMVQHFSTVFAPSHRLLSPLTPTHTVLTQLVPERSKK